MTALKYVALAIAGFGALAIAPRIADAGLNNRTHAWCKPRPVADETILSDASAALVWKATGDLALEPANHLATKIWSSGTADRGAKLCWESSGAFAVYDPAGTKLWSQGGTSLPPPVPYPSADYVIDPAMSGCNVSAKYRTYLPAPPPNPFRGPTVGAGKLWTKTGVCPDSSKTAIGNDWCVDNTADNVLLEEDWSRLVWKAGGTLALVGTGSAASTTIWQAPVQGAKLCFGKDGALAIYDTTDHALWNTSPRSTSAGYMLGLEDCSLQVVPLDGSASPFTSAHRCPQTQLAFGKTIFAGASDIVIVQNDDAQLVYGHDGNLALRSVAGDDYWNSALSSGQGKRVVFQSDGNVVIYDAGGTARWSSKTAGQGTNLLSLDGCQMSLLAGSTTKWVRGSSSCSTTSLDNAWSLSASGNTTLLRTEDARLVWQSDGNLVLYTTSGHALWDTNTDGKGKTLSFQSDGNLVIYNGSDAVWDSNTDVSGSPSRTLGLGDSCTLTIADGSTVKWTGNSSCAIVNYSYDRSDGNSKFAATFHTALTAEDTGTARVDSTTGIDVKIFGTSHELFSATTYQTETDNGSDLRNVAVAIFGESTVSVNFTYEQTFFEIEETFIVGIVPVSVTAGATGELGLGLTYASGTLTATPSAGIYATVEAGVGAENDAAGASAGIRGSLTIIELSLPISMKVYVESGKAKYTVSGDIDIETLSGSLELYAEAYVKVWGIKIGVDWSKTLVSWDGLSWDKTLFSKSGTF